MELFVNINSFFLLFVLAFHLGLALFVYLKDPKSEVHRTFSFLLFSVVLWIASFLFFLNVKFLEWVLFLRRLTPVGSALVAGLLLYFSLIFPKIEKPLPFWVKFVCLFPGIIFSFLSIFSSLMVKDFIVTDFANPFLGKPVFGPVYRVYSVYFILYFFLGLGNLIYKYLKADGREKLQIFYVLFGISLSGVLGLTVSLVLPSLGFPYLFTAGPPFTLIMAFFTTYAIVRYKLLNIEDFLFRGVLFLAVATVLVGTSVFLFLKQFNFIFPFYVILANLTLGHLVYFQNPRNKVNLSFYLVTISIALWTFGVCLFWNVLDANLAFLGGKIAFLGASAIPAFMLFFSWVFPKELKPITPFGWMIIVLPLLIFPSMVFMNLVLKEVVSLAGRVQRSYGPAYPLFLVYYLLYFGMFFFDLILKERRFTGISRIQVRYVFLGFGLSSAIAVTTNLILPFFGIGAFSFIGPHATLIMVGIIAYAIIKHRLMSIEVVIQRSTVYALSTILIMTLYALAVVVSEIYLRKVIGYTSLIITALAALAIAIAYQPVVKFFQNLTDRLFFRGRYDYQKTLRKISHEITSVIKLEELARLVVSSFIDTMRIVEMSFLLLEKEKEHFRSIPISLPHYKRIEIDVKSPIVSFLMSTKDILVKDEIEDEISRQEVLGKEGEIRRKSLEEVRDEMERLGISIWVPVVSKEELIGIIALGEKLSGDVYTTEDLALLATLSNQIAVALDNARLYDEVVTMKDYSEEILQSMTNGVLTTDTSGKVVTFNLMAERITGRKASEVLGKSCEEIWGKRGAITIAIENTLKDRCYVNFESSVVSPERGLVPVSFSSTLLRDLHGKKMGALLSIQDLSEVKALEDKVRRADKLSALATMAAGMAHEIKNPLSSMKVFSQLLPKRFEDPEFRKKLEEILPREIDRIDRIVESLLGFARATTPTFEKVKIEEIIEENLKYYEQQAKNAGVVIKRNYAELPEIEVDRNQISQVFSNLILNAIQAMPEGGELSVVTLPGKKVDDTVQSIKVKISDTGHGIPEEMKKKLFDPFFTTKYGGTGLGLTITHSIVDGHKGFIDVESQVGKGTTFTITLPVSQGLV